MGTHTFLFPRTGLKLQVCCGVRLASPFLISSDLLEGSSYVFIEVVESVGLYFFPPVLMYEGSCNKMGSAAISSLVSLHHQLNSKFVFTIIYIKITKSNNFRSLQDHHQGLHTSNICLPNNIYDCYK